MCTIKKTIFLLAAIPAICQAEFWSGNYLLQQMTGATSDRFAAIGYVAGSADAVTNIYACPPQGVTVGQVYDMVKQLLEFAPELRHHSADSFVRTAMQNKWPCKQTNQGRGT